MRVLGIVGLVTLGLGLVGMAGCEDAKSPSVQPDIGWKVGCAAGSTGCTQFKYHVQDSAMYARDFKVSCTVNGDNVSFTITDPGLEPTEVPPGWPASVLSVQNGNAAGNACNVTVTDAMDYGQAAITMTGSCGNSGGVGGCTLTRGPNESGWDWVGSLACEKLERNSMPTPKYRLNGRDGLAPVTIKLANCD